MRELQLVDIQLTTDGLRTFCDGIGLSPVPEDDGPPSDLGHEVHAWLTAAFGYMAPKPWRDEPGADGWWGVHGYSVHAAAELRSQMGYLGAVDAFGAIDADLGRITSRPVPTWHPGQRLGFDVLCCPIGRRARSGVEKDLFLLRLDQAEADEALNREGVYCEWGRERLERTGAAAVDWIRLASFRQVRQLRKTQGAPGTRQCRWIERPSALLGGQLTVRDADAFQALLAHGIGRHRAFGYGMIRVWPAGEGGDES